MNKHTPGPWQHGDLDDGDTIYVFGRGEDTLVCEVNDTDLDADEAEGNARLIAAAPELLAACKAAVEYAETCRDIPEFSSGYCIGTDHLEAIKAAIAKAEGGAA